MQRHKLVHFFQNLPSLTFPYFSDVRRSKGQQAMTKSPFGYPLLRTSDHHDTLKKVSVTIPILCSKFVSDTIFDTFFKKYPIRYRYFFDTLAAKIVVVYSFIG